MIECRIANITDPSGLADVIDREKAAIEAVVNAMVDAAEGC